MSVVIRAVDGRVLYTSEKATVREALEDAVAAGSDLSYSDLRGSNLSYSDLSGSNLSYSNLRGSNLRGSNLSGSNLRGSNLRGSNLRGSNLRGSNLRGSNLSGSNLSYSNLSGSNLSYSDTCLSISGLPSGHAILAPLPEGWRLTIDCWNGTVTDLREMIARDIDWPEATGVEILARRPILAALADMCDAWTATKQDVLQEIQTKWATTEVTA